MHIDCQLDYATIQANQARPVHLGLKFTAPILDRPRAEACAFALVLDHSGSMKGTPLEYAKKACLTALKNLRPGDQCSVVQFASEARVVIPLQTVGNSRTGLQAAIEAITDGDSTNLTAGWMLGRDELKKAGTGTRRRLLLLTDGELNAGITDALQVEKIVASGLEKEGIRTATLGFGNEYNDTLLRSLAKLSNGEFYDVDSVEKLPPIFTAELEGLQSQTVTNLRVRIKPLVFCESWVQCSDYHMTPLPDGRAEISLGDLTSGEERSLVLALEVLPLPLQADGTPLTSLDGELLLGLEILWDQVDEKEITSRRHEQILRIQATQNPEDIKVNEDMVAIIATQIAGKVMDEASKDVMAHRLDEARARLVKLQELLETYGVPEKLSDARRLLERMDQVIQQGGFNSRSVRTARYTSGSARKMSSHALWVASESAPAYSNSSKVPPPQAAPKAKPTNDDDPGRSPAGEA
jgi:Ca-activated chloride channel family protein